MTYATISEQKLPVAVTVNLLTAGLRGAASRLSRVASTDVGTELVRPRGLSLP